MTECLWNISDNKQLLDEVFVISRITKESESSMYNKSLYCRTVLQIRTKTPQQQKNGHTFFTSVRRWLLHKMTVVSNSQSKE